jgi:hypothetical protein
MAVTMTAMFVRLIFEFGFWVDTSSSSSSTAATAPLPRPSHQELRARDRARTRGLPPSTSTLFFYFPGRVSPLMRAAFFSCGAAVAARERRQRAATPPTPTRPRERTIRGRGDGERAGVLFAFLPLQNSTSAEPRAWVEHCTKTPHTPQCGAPDSSTKTASGAGERTIYMVTQLLAPALASVTRLFARAGPSQHYGSCAQS